MQASFALRAFISLLQAGILGEGFSRIFISFPGVFFNMSMNKNECIEGPGSLFGQLCLCLEFVWF